MTSRSAYGIRIGLRSASSLRRRAPASFGGGRLWLGVGVVVVVVVIVMEVVLVGAAGDDEAAALADPVVAMVADASTAANMLRALEFSGRCGGRRNLCSGSRAGLAGVGALVAGVYTNATHKKSQLKIQ